MAHKPGHKRFGTRGLNLAKHALKIINPGQDASNTYSKADLERLRNKRKENDKKQEVKKENRKKTKTELKTLKEKLKSKTGSDGKTRAQRMAIERRMRKLKNPNEKRLTGAEKAKQMARERIAKKKENEAKAKRTKKNKKVISKIGGRGGFTG